MFKQYYNIAGIDICVAGKEEEMKIKGEKMEAFRTETEGCFHKYEFSIVEKLDKEIGACIYKDAARQIYQNNNKRICYLGTVKENVLNAYLRSETEEERTLVQVCKKQIQNKVTSKVVLNSLGMEWLAIKAGGFILHASFININNKAILFTAPSGIGKSTQAELWKLHRNADIINGDRAVVRLENDKTLACGLPFAGSSEYCKNATLPIEAIVYLEQAPETTISPLKGIQAFRKIWEQITVPVWDKEAVNKISEILSRVISEIPIYHLACTPDFSAILALENELAKLHPSND